MRKIDYNSPLQPNKNIYMCLGRRGITIALVLFPIIRVLPLLLFLLAILLLAEQVMTKTHVF